MQALDNNLLDKLPDGVDGPAFDRSTVTAGIAHIGVGAFHRAHLAIYMQRVLADADQREWGILGVNLLAQDEQLAKGLRAQDYLYTVSELDPDGGRASHVVGAMVDYLYAPDDPAALLGRLADPAIRIVSMTITEGGYLIDEHGHFDLTHDSVVHDLAHPHAPRTMFGFVIGALERRRAAGVAPFTVMSCDNLRHNGAQTRRACLAYAQAHSPTLARWIETEVDFPNAMVDRITPATTPERREQLNAMTGIDDHVPVVAEDFIQWVLEDTFRHGRPAWERYGVQIVDDVTPYEEAKIRLLNGSHQMLAYPAFLAGHRKVDDALHDTLFHDYLRDFLDKDASPWLQSLPGMDLPSYKPKLLERFGNGAIADQLDRLCLDGGSKIPGFLQPTIEACLKNGSDTSRLAFLLACFDRYVRAGEDDNGATYPLREPNNMQRIQPMIDSDSPNTLIESVELVGPEPARHARFIAQYLACCAQLEEHGVRHTLEHLHTLCHRAG